MNIAVACGGTGGHVFPGFVTARELQRRGNDVTLWLTGRPTEQAAVDEWTGRIVQIPAQGFSGGGLRSLRTAWALYRATRASRTEMQQNKPAVLLAMGAYASAGPCAAAVSLGVPLVLHEANVIPGRMIRLFARKAAGLATGFEETRFHLPARTIDVVGIPLRDELVHSRASLPEWEKTDGSPLCLLVEGGSLGSKRLNDLMIQVIPKLAAQGYNIDVMHLTGAADEQAVKDAYRAAGVRADVAAFTSNMAPLYYRADLAICRAGASTCAELSLFGVPALFVPYPKAAKNHQMANARALEKRGLADVVEESVLSTDWLEHYIAENIRHPERLDRLRQAARKEGVPDGTQALADLVEKCGQAHAAAS